MAALRPCLERIRRADKSWGPCGVLSPNTRCPEHQRSFEKKRREKEPWRRIYEDPRWYAVRPRVIARDGERCTFAIGGRRCNTVALLEVHHEEKLRHIWARLGSPQRGEGNWNAFVLAACDMRNLRTLCHEHHKFVDNNNPEEKWVGKPSERATSQHRRVRRASKRRNRKVEEITKPRTKRDYTADD